MARRLTGAAPFVHVWCAAMAAVAVLAAHHAVVPAPPASPAASPAPIPPTRPAAPHSAGRTSAPRLPLRGAAPRLGVPLSAEAGAEAPPGRSCPAARGATARPSLLDAIAAVETGGAKDPDYAVGRDGERGRYQIGRAYWTDAVEWAVARGLARAADWPYEPRVHDAASCRQVVVWYACRWEPGCSDPESLARLHNGGPNWRSKPSTIAYWRRVRARMRQGDRHG